MTKPQSVYRDMAVANGGRSVGILLELAKSKITMHDGMHLPRVARMFYTTIDNVAKCAERHNDLLQYVKGQAMEINELRLQIAELKAQRSQGIGPNNKIQPWQMTTPEFKAHLKETYVDAFGDECVSFGSKRDDTPLCSPKF